MFITCRDQILRKIRNRRMAIQRSHLHKAHKASVKKSSKKMPRNRTISMAMTPVMPGYISALTLHPMTFTPWRDQTTRAPFITKGHGALSIMIHIQAALHKEMISIGLLTTRLTSGSTGLGLVRIQTQDTMMFILWCVQISIRRLCNGQDHHSHRPKAKTITTMTTGPATGGSSTHMAKSHSHHHTIQSGTGRTASWNQFTSQLSQRLRLFKRSLRSKMITNTTTGMATDGSNTHRVESHSHHHTTQSGTGRTASCPASTSQSSQQSNELRKQ